MRTLILLPLAALLACTDTKTEQGISGTSGEDGAPGEGGEDGEPGADGEDGEDGSDGVPCWDLDGDGEPDPEEDTNGDGVVDVDDCRNDGGGDDTGGGSSGDAKTVVNLSHDLDGSECVDEDGRPIEACCPEGFLAVGTYYEGYTAAVCVEEVGTGRATFVLKFSLEGEDCEWIPPSECCPPEYPPVGFLDYGPTRVVCLEE